MWYIVYSRLLDPSSLTGMTPVDGSGVEGRKWCGYVRVRMYIVEAAEGLCGW